MHTIHIQHISNIRQLPAMRSIHSFHQSYRIIQQYHSLIIKYIFTLLSFTSFIYSLIHSVIQEILNMQGTDQWLRNIENTQFDYSVILAIKYIQNHKYTYISIICSSSSFYLEMQSMHDAN